MDEEIANCANCCNLQKVANQRHNSSIRSLRFSYPFFFVDIERTYFRTPETSKNMYDKAKACQNACHDCKLRVFTNAKHQEMRDNNTQEGAGENPAERFHCADISVKPVNTAYLFLEQILEMSERA